VAASVHIKGWIYTQRKCPGTARPAGPKRTEPPISRDEMRFCALAISSPGTFRRSATSKTVSTQGRQSSQSPNSMLSAGAGQGREEAIPRWRAIMKIRCGSNSVGRVSASQAEGRGFESRLPLHSSKICVLAPGRGGRESDCRQLESPRYAKPAAAGTLYGEASVGPGIAGSLRRQRIPTCKQTTSPRPGLHVTPFRTPLFPLESEWLVRRWAVGSWHQLAG
jgi:hypothetical protein